MDSNQFLEPGFYWIRFEGSIIVAEYQGNGCWLVPGSNVTYSDDKVCELLSAKLSPRKVMYADK